MTQDNNTSLVGKGTFKFTQQLYTDKNIGDGVPLMEASYIAAPKSIQYNSFSKTYSWTPLSTYLSYITESYITTFKKIGNNTLTKSNVTVISSLSKNESEKNTISYNTVTIPLTEIYNEINTIKNSSTGTLPPIGTLPPSSPEPEISISNTVGINVITNVGTSGNLISYTYTPIKVNFKEITDSIADLNTKIDRIINFIDPQITYKTIPSEIIFTGENYESGVNAYVETNITNTSLVKWASTDTKNIKLSAYVGLNNVIIPIGYKNTSSNDKITISISTTNFNGVTKTEKTEIPLKYNKTYGGLINISYTVYNEYI